MHQATRFSVTAVFCLATGLGLAASPGPAHASELRPDRTESPRFEVPPGSQMPLREVQYQVDISGVVARVHLTQTYEGPSATGPGSAASHGIEARYVFPLSTRAAVGALRMQIGPRTIEGVIKERGAAKAAYDAARAAGQIASLLEQERPNVFEMRVANLRPGDIVQVEVDYVELLMPTEGIYQIVIPGMVSERYDGNPSSPEGLEAALNQPAAALVPTLAATGNAARDAWRSISVHLEGAVPIQWVESPTHHITQTTDQADDSVDIELADVERDPARDFELSYALAGQALETGVLRFDGEDAHYFLALVEPPERVAPEAIPPREIVFVLDTSGSMQGFALDTARTLIRQMLRTLRPVDRFNVLAFAGSSEVFATTSRAPTRANLAALDAFLGQMGSGGGTELLPALRTAFALPAAPNMARTFAIVTDGFVTVEPEAFALVRAQAAGASVFAFGIGPSVNRFLIEGLAHAGQGQAFICEGEARAAEVAEDFRDYIDAPALTHVALAFQGIDAYDVEPAVIPDVYAHRPVFVLGKYRTAAPDAALVVSGLTGTGPWNGTTRLSAVVPSPRNAALPTLWARERIARISDSSIATEASKAEVTELGLRYSLMTAHTSFVAIDDGAEVAATPPSAGANGDSEFVVGAGSAGLGFAGDGMGGGGAPSAGRLQGMGQIDSGVGIGQPANPSRSTVGLGAIQVTARGVSAAWLNDAKRVFARRFGAFRQCLEHVLGTNPIGRPGDHFAAKLRLTLMPDSDPSMLRPTTVQATLAAFPPETTTCLSQHARRALFPGANHRGPVVLDVTIDFVRH